MDSLATSIRELLARQVAEKRQETLDAIHALDLANAEASLTQLKAILGLQEQIEGLLPPLLPSAPTTSKPDAPQRVVEPKPAEKPEPIPAPVAPETAAKVETKPVPAKLQPAKPKVAPKTGRDIGRRRTEFLAAVRTAEANPGSFREALGKALICSGRGCLEEADERDHQTVKGEVQRAIAIWNEQTREKEFFGCNLGRRHSPDIWFELADDYRKLDVVQETRDFLEAGPAVGEEDRVSLIDRAAAAETLFYRVNQEKGLGVSDSQQRELHAWLVDQQVLVKWWREESNGGPSTREVREAASELPELLKREKSRAAQSAAKAKLLSFSVAEPGPDFIRDLADHLEACLAAGVRPADKSLTGFAMPFVHLLQELNRRSLDTLLRHTEKQLNAVGTRVDLELFDQPGDEEPSEAEQALRKLVEGKIIAFIGGNKGQEKRRQELIDRLGLKDLIWPDSEDHTKPRALRTAADKADIVALLIRFSRHSYKSVLDHAKASGKQTATITSGLGINRIVHDLLRQLS